MLIHNLVKMHANHGTTHYCNRLILVPSNPLSFNLDSQFLMPGLVDAHNHPSLYSYTGTGYDMSIHQRLEKFKIPTEAKFADTETAKEIYPKAVVCFYTVFLAITF